MTLTQHEEAEWQKHKVFRLTAVWSANVRKALAPTENVWPPLVPRVCRLYLGTTEPHWPYCLEWLGPTGPRGEDSLLMQMEFLSPRFKGASEKPTLDYDRLFTFDPGKAKVLDRTQEVNEFALQVRNQIKPPAKAPDR
jgi:hypothetical protein